MLLWILLLLSTSCYPGQEAQVPRGGHRHSLSAATASNKIGRVRLARRDKCSAASAAEAEIQFDVGRLRPVRAKGTGSYFKTESPIGLVQSSV